MPRISVMMAVYNDANGLERSVGSILHQTFRDFELIACDDGSTDGSYEALQNWAKSDPRVIALRNEQNMRAGPARNRCISKSSGEFVACMDSDDISCADRFEKQLAFLEGCSEYAFVSCAARLFDEAGIWGVRQPPEKPEKRDLVRGSRFFHPGCMFRKSALDAVGGYSEAKWLRFSEDYDLFMRMYAKGMTGYNMQEPLIDYYEGRNSRARSDYGRRINEARVRLRGYSAMGVLPAALPYALKPLAVGLTPYSLRLWLRRRRQASAASSSKACNGTEGGNG